MFGVLDIDDERARRAAYCSSKAVFSGVGPVRPPRLLDAFSGGTPAPTPENACSQGLWRSSGRSPEVLSPVRWQAALGQGEVAVSAASAATLRHGAGRTDQGGAWLPAPGQGARRVAPGQPAGE
jgi:hypothetical protein